MKILKRGAALAMAMFLVITSIVYSLLFRTLNDASFFTLNCAVSV